MFKTVVIMLFILMIGVSVYAEDLTTLQPPTEFSPQTQEQIRQEWEQTLHFDVWAPYFYLMNIEEFLTEHLKVQLGPFHGKPEINYKEKRFMYRFQWRF